jgi:hypothetical protein
MLTYKELYHKQLVKYFFKTSSQRINYETQSTVQQMVVNWQFSEWKKNSKNSSHIYYSCIYLVVYKY